MPPRLARLLAILAAIVLVAGAFAVRAALSDDGGGTAADRNAGGSDDGDDDAGPDAAAFRLICDEDLGADVCAAVSEVSGADVEVRTVAEVIDPGVAGEDIPADAWLTLDGLPQALDGGRDDAGLPALVSTPPTEVASSPLALLARAEPPGGCGEDPAVRWSCLVAPPEPLQSGLAIPSTDTAVGMLVLAAGAVDLEDGDTEFGIGAYEGTENAELLAALVDDSPTAAGATTEAQTTALFSAGTASGAVTFAGLAVQQAGTAQGGDRGLRVVPLDPPVTMGVALVGLGPNGPDAVAALEAAVSDQTVRDALIAAGWDGEPTGSSGFPDFDVVYALRERLG